MEVQALAAQDAVAILPLAAIEQHGPHLPLSTDLDIGQGLLQVAFQHLPENFPAWVLPPVAVGTSLEHSNFAGTLSLPPEQLLANLVALGHSVHSSGVKRLLMHNSHGGNVAVMDLAALQLRRELGMLVVKSSYFRLALPAPVPFFVHELVHGLHGGALETSLMLHFHPERVRQDLLANATSLGEHLAQALQRLGPEGQASFAWMAEDLHPSGSVGAADIATAADGAWLAEHYGTALAQVIQDARAFPLSSLATSTLAPLSRTSGTAHLRGKIRS